MWHQNKQIRPLIDNFASRFRYRSIDQIRLVRAQNVRNDPLNTVLKVYDAGLSLAAAVCLGACEIHLRACISVPNACPSLSWPCIPIGGAWSQIAWWCCSTNILGSETPQNWNSIAWAPDRRFYEATRFKPKCRQCKPKCRSTPKCRKCKPKCRSTPNISLMSSM